MATVTQDADAAALDPQFLTQTPAGRRSSTPVPPCAPGGQSVPRHGGSAPFHRRLVRRLSTRSPDASAPDGQPATASEMR